MVEAQKVHPKVKWAQRQDVISMVIEIQDVKEGDWTMNLSPEQAFTFEATLNGVKFGFTIDKFYKTLDVASAKMHYNNRSFSIII